MSRSSSTTFLVGIGPSGSSQLTIPLSTPTSTFLTSTSTVVSTTSTTPTSTSMSATFSHLVTPTATSGASSGPSKNTLIGAIVGGTLGGIVALLWFATLIYYAHRHNCFRRPGYQRAREERAMFEKRDRPASGSQTSGGFGDRPPGPQNGMGGRTFGEPPRSTFNNPPRPTYNDPPRGPPPPPKPISIFGGPRNAPEPPRNTYNDPPRNDPPRTTFSEPQRGGYNDPPRSMFDNAPSSNYGNRPISGFGDNGRDRDRDRGRPRSNFGMDRPRSGFGDRPRSAYGDGGVGRRSVSLDQTRRGFFGGGLLNSDGTGGEWEGAGARRVEGGYGTPETGWMGWLARARDNAARRKRIRSEYEEDMRQMRGRSVMGSEYRGY